jgi:hypothetical protein
LLLGIHKLSFGVGFNSTTFSQKGFRTAAFGPAVTWDKHSSHAKLANLKVKSKKKEKKNRATLAENLHMLLAHIERAFQRD